MNLQHLSECFALKFTTDFEFGKRLVLKHRTHTQKSGTLVCIWINSLFLCCYSIIFRQNKNKMVRQTNEQSLQEFASFVFLSLFIHLCKNKIKLYLILFSFFAFKCLFACLWAPLYWTHGYLILFKSVLHSTLTFL